MKILIASFLTVLAGILNPLSAQSSVNGCITFPAGLKISLAIPGSKDSRLVNSDIKAKKIEGVLLINGFELVADASLLKVLTYVATFDTDKGRLCSKRSVGSKLLDDNPDLFSMKEIVTGKYLTIDMITVEYKGFCYKYPSQLYMLY